MSAFLLATNQQRMPTYIKANKTKNYMHTDYFKIQS
jgi:hypothetical protein